MADIFISYKSDDRHRVAGIATELERLGYSVWWDPQIEIGARYADDIAQQLDGAKAVIVVWTDNSVGSDWVRHEADVARESEKLIPVRLDAARLPPPHNQFQCANLANWPHANNSDWAKVLARVGRLVNAIGADRTPKARIKPASLPLDRSGHVEKRPRKFLRSFNDMITLSVIGALIIGGAGYALVEGLSYRGNGRSGSMQLVCEYRLTAASGLSPINSGRSAVNVFVEFEPQSFGEDAKWTMSQYGQSPSMWEPVEGGSNDSLCLDRILGRCTLELNLQSSTLTNRHDGRGGAPAGIVDEGRCREADAREEHIRPPSMDNCPMCSRWGRSPQQNSSASGGGTS